MVTIEHSFTIPPVMNALSTNIDIKIGTHVLNFSSKLATFLNWKGLFGSPSTGLSVNKDLKGIGRMRRHVPQSVLLICKKLSRMKLRLRRKYWMIFLYKIWIFLLLKIWKSKMGFFFCLLIDTYLYFIYILVFSVNNESR